MQELLLCLKVLHSLGTKMFSQFCWIWQRWRIFRIWLTTRILKSLVYSADQRVSVVVDSVFAQHLARHFFFEAEDLVMHRN